MKKFLITILSLALLVSALMFVGCNAESKWAGTSLVNGGAVCLEKNGGFVAETEKYVYFINGIGTSTDDNTYGQPVKGSLMVCEKDKLGTADLKAEIVVPKLFVASDYKSGISIFGEGAETYVYYGTPCTEKNSGGKIANSNMTFMRTRLDGKKSDTFFTVSALSNEYRFVENNGVVYILYYDSTSEALYSYNTQTKKATEIVNEDSTVAGKMTALNEYKFLTDGKILYTETVYSEDYYADKAEKSGYSRATESYNKLMVYTAGAEAKEVNKDYTFTLGTEYTGFITLTAKDARDVEKKFIIKTSDLDAGATLTEIKNSAVSDKSLLIENVNSVYYIDSDNGYIVKTTLTDAGILSSERIAKTDKVSTLLFLNDDYMYFYDSDNGISRIKVSVSSAEVEKVSESTVSTTWYNPEIVTANGVDYLFYNDNTTEGSSYTKFVNIDGVVQSETDEDTDVTTYFLEGQTFVGKMLDKDFANGAIARISEIPSTLELKLDKDGNFYSEEVNTARNAVTILEGITSDADEYIGETNLTKLENAETAVIYAGKLDGLKNMMTYENLSDEQKADIKAYYEQVKTYRQKLIDNGNYETVRDMIESNLKYYYQLADKEFTVDED